MHVLKKSRSTANNHEHKKRHGARTRTHGAEHVRHATTTPPRTEEHGGEDTTRSGDDTRGGVVSGASAEH